MEPPSEAEAPATPPEGYRTPTGEPCPRSVRVDGTIEGSGACYCCGYCLGLETAAWPEP